MGFINNFLNQMNLNDDEYDEDYDDFEEEYEEKPKRVSMFGSKRKSVVEDESEEEDENTFSKTYTNRFREETPTYSARPKSTPVVGRNSNIVPLTSAKNNEIYVIKPIEDSECWSIIDFLKSGKSIIINLEGMNVSEAQHIIDIIVGSCYTIEGSIKRISDSIFVAAPSNTEVSGDVLSQVLMGDGGSLNLKSTKF